MAKKHLSEIQQDAANVNKHSERGSALTRKSIEKFGARLAGVVDRRGVIIDGNDRQIAYGELDLSEVEIVKANPSKPVYLQFDDLDLADPDNPARELQVALHRSAVESWTVDAEALMAHMQSGVEVDDWFRQDELDALMAELMPPNTTGNTEPQIDKAAELRQKYGVELGQLWELGQHRLIVGDCTDRATVERVMGGERAATTNTDPPYNVGRDYTTETDDERKDYEVWSRQWFAMALDYSDVIAFSCGHPNVVMWATIAPWKWIICWYKPGAMLGSPFGFSNWEPVLFYGKALKKGTDVINAPIIVSDDPAMKAHPVPKQVDYALGLLEMTSEPGDIVFDPFAGSGTTGVACHNLGRKARMIEIAPNYAAVILERMQTHTGQTPRLVT